MNIKAGDVVVHKLGERLLVLEVNQQDANCYRYLKCRRPNFDIVTIKDREIAGLEPDYLLAVSSSSFLNPLGKRELISMGKMKLVPPLPASAESPPASRDEWSIFGLLSRLEDLWNRYPQLRLGQLIGNVYSYPYGNDFYNAEDEKLISALEEFYGKEGGVQ